MQARFKQVRNKLVSKKPAVMQKLLGYTQMGNRQMRHRQGRNQKSTSYTLIQHSKKKQLWFKQMHKRIKSEETGEVEKGKVHTTE